MTNRDKVKFWLAIAVFALSLLSVSAIEGGVYDIKYIVIGAAIGYALIGVSMLVIRVMMRYRLAVIIRRVRRTSR